MKVVVGLLVLFAAYFAYREVDRHYNGFDQIEWRGEKFKLNQKYVDWEDYKSSTHQLHASEVPRVESLVVATRVPDWFKSRDSLISDIPELRFPGYGVLHDGTRKAPNGAELQISEYRIPETDKSRRLTYRREADESYRLVSDEIVRSGP